MYLSTAEFVVLLADTKRQSHMQCILTSHADFCLIWVLFVSLGVRGILVKYSLLGIYIYICMQL